MKTNDILKITHAHKYYNRGKSNELHVMNDIDLALPSSGMIAIFGQSGCGKTTLLNAVGGLDSIAEGSIELFGENLARNTDVVRNKYVGYIFQNYNLNVGETVFENVADALRLCGMTDAEEIRTRVLSSLKNVGMDKFKNRTPDTLSGGQQQRVAIARALVKSPAVLLADEPTGNLDEANTVLVMDILKELSKTRLVLLVTHEANLVDFYCDRVIRIVDGKVAEDRENQDANGYIARDKNDIYLGELEKTEETVSGVTLTRYGTPDVPVKLRLVTSGGHTYLVCDSPEVRILDESSEIRLREGVFRTVGRDEEEENEKPQTKNTLDLSALTPFEGSSFGRLFGWKNALSSAWSENFAKKQKKGTVLLRLTLILLAVVIVFTTAVSAVSIRSLTEVSKETDANLFYVKLEKDTDYQGLNEYPASSGIDGTWITSAHVPETVVTLFDTASFMTAVSPTIQGTASFAPVTVMKNAEVAAGTAELKKENDVLITTAFGDELIESSTAAYIDSYEDLIGLKSPTTGWGNSKPYRIVGVVRSDEKLILTDPLSFAETVLSDVVSLTTFNGLYAQSKQNVYNEPVKKGELIVLNGTFEEGETVRLFGKDFLVAHADHSASFSRLSDYLQYYTDKTRLTIADYAGYAETGDPNVPVYRKYCEWVYEVFPQDGAFRDFCRMLVDRYLPWADAEMSIDLWAYANTGDVTAYLSLLSALDGQPNGIGGTYNTMPLGIVNQTYACYLYHEKTGEWPDEPVSDETMLSAYFEDWDRLYVGNNLYDKYEQFVSEQYQTKYSSHVQYVVSDEDYIALAGSAGKSDERLGIEAFEVESWDGSVWYQNHMAVHASDPEAAKEYLLPLYGDKVVTPEELFDSALSENKAEILGSAVAILVMLALMCLCVFFIMRSSFMHRVREVGIYRAIGVTKKNLIFRFTVEALLLVSLTVLPAFLLSSLIIVYLSGGVLLGSVFYFPLWLAAGLLIVLYAASVFCGVLPVITLLSHTPSEILAKYDI